MGSSAGRFGVSLPVFFASIRCSVSRVLIPGFQAAIAKIAAVAACFLVLVHSPTRAFVPVNPSVVELVVKPGKTIKGNIVVSNPNSEKILVDMEAQKWWHQQTKLPELPIEKWLTLSPKKSFYLSPGESKPVKYKVKLPGDWSGEVMAMVFFSSNSPGKKDGKTINIQMRHGVPIYAIAKGTEDLRINIENVSTRLTHGSTSSPIESSISIYNLGNVHIRPKGKFQIFSNENLMEEFSPEWGDPVLPKHQHNYVAQTKKSDWSPGDYKLKLTIEHGDFHKNVAPLEKMVEFTITEEGKIK